MKIKSLFKSSICGIFIATASFFILSQAAAPRVLLAEDNSREAEALFVAQKAFEDGFYDVCLSLLERYLRNYPASSKVAQVNLLTGRCYFHQNKFLEALKKFEEVFDLPGGKDIKDAVFYWIAEVNFRGNNFSRAASYYKMIIDGFPDSAYAVSAYYSLGWCLFQEQKFREALESFKTVEEKFPMHPQVQEATFKVIECLYNLKDYSGLKDKLKAHLKNYSRDNLKTAYLYFYLAEAEYYLGNLNDAVDAYSRVVSATDDVKIQALSRLGMGWAYLKLKQYEQAEGSFKLIPADSLEKHSQDALSLGRAILYFDTGKFQESKETYARLIESTNDPVTLVQAYLGKADSLYSLGEYKGSAAAYLEASDKVSDGSIPAEMIDKLHYGLAWAYLKDGQFKEAITEFKKIVSLSEDKIIKISALCQIGDAYQDSGDYVKAQETYDSILRDYPDSFYGDYVQYQLGLSMLKLSNYEGAVLSFLNFKRNFPSSTLLDDASYALGLAYFQKQDYNSSKEIFLKFQEGFPQSNLASQAMYLLGTSFYNLADFARAIEVFKNIIRIYGQDIELVQRCEYEIADSYSQMGNDKEAMSRFNSLRAKYPDSALTPAIIWWLGEFYYRQNDLNLAKRYFSALIRDFPKSNLTSDAYYALGSIYAEEGKYPEGVGNFEKVIGLAKSELAGQAEIAIADIYARQEKLDLAVSIYKEKIKEYPNLAHLIYPRIGDIFSRMGKYDEALIAYYKSLDLVPLRQVPQIRFKIAEMLQSQGKNQDAVEEYLKVTYLDTRNAELGIKSFLRVAKIYEDSDKFAEAVNIYKKVAEIGVPESKFAQERIEALKTQ
ncbi:MAG: tetratricopeptide repeat protein [Candidatus Omnitrophica bacterium]|jgi:TolA-binding protein|nr:tetratricopeptide repeat protein [Candidatus Omnitrophota bacterium]